MLAATLLLTGCTSTPSASEPTSSPSPKLVKHSGFSDQYVIVGSKGQLVFDVATSTASEVAWDKSKVGTVIWVYLQDQGHLIFSIANTGLGGDVCATE